MPSSSTATTLDVGRGPSPAEELGDAPVGKGIFPFKTDSDDVGTATLGGKVAADPNHPGGGGGGGPLCTCPTDGLIQTGGGRGGGGGGALNGLDLDRRGGGGRLVLISTSLSLPELLEDVM